MSQENAIAGVIRHHSKSFALAARLLPPQARQDAVLLYAWCRRADDAVDHAPSPIEARAKLDELRQELSTLNRGAKPGNPLMDRMQSLLRRRGIPCVYLDDLLEGMATDLSCPRLQTQAELEKYTYQVAGTVGLMMAHVLGVRREHAMLHAAHLGMAMQLTNIARDVREDAERGRCYLPAEWFTPPRTPNWGDPEVPQVLARLLALAEDYYASGCAGLNDLDRRAGLAIDVAQRVYRAIGTRLVALDYPINRRVVVPTTTKVGLIGAAMQAASSRPLTPGPSRVPQRVWCYDNIQLQPPTQG